MIDWLVCADANLTLKLVLPEHDSPVAEELWEAWQTRGTTVIAPTLWGYEVTSVIRKRAHRKYLPPDVEEKVITTIHQLRVQLLRPAGLHQRAWELARYFGLPAAYDAHYLALAEMADCPFWTADERLFSAVCEELNWVHWLGNYQADAPAAEQKHES